jgi:hypothetical protein
MEADALPKLQQLVRRAFSKVEERDVFTGDVYEVTTIEVDDTDPSLCYIKLGTSEHSTIEDASKLAPMVLDAIRALIRVDGAKIKQTPDAVIISVHSQSIHELQLRSVNVRSHMDAKAARFDPKALDKHIYKQPQQNNTAHAA